MRKREVGRRLGLLGVVAATVFAMLPAAAFAAAGAYTGGPDQWPSYVTNDHTPAAVHFTAEPGSGLAPLTSYYVKVRYTVGTTPSGTTNRGFTWNPASNRWVQERDPWTSFPQVQTDASGAITSSAGWTFAKFGDDAKSGQYHIMISLSATGESSTFNGSFVPTITVLDPRVDAAWVHNGVATGKAAAKRAALMDEASATVLSLQKTEAQVIDDDSDGVVDNEDYGPVGATGDFRFGAPVATALGVNLNQAVWAPGNGFEVTLPDVDLAIGAEDTQAPTAPSLVSATSGDGSATLTWNPATDNNSVAGYYVYRWQSAPLGAAYSPIHGRVATLAADAINFGDSGLTNGSTYYYEIRAFDASTNVGPRSTTATAVPFVAKPTALVAPSSPDGENGWYRTGPTVTLTPSGPGRTSVYSFAPVPSTWTTYTVPLSIGEGLSTLTYADTDGHAMSATSALALKVDTTLPTAQLKVPPTIMNPTNRTSSLAISWSGTDTVSGLAGYDVEYKSGASGSWKAFRSSTTATSAVFPGTAGANYYFRVMARDVAGNESPWTTSACVVVPYNQGKASLSASWKKTTNSHDYLGSARYTKKKGAYATLKFTSGTLYLVARKGPTMGKMAVYYGGKRITTVNLHSSTTKYRQVIKIVTKPAGTSSRTVKFVNLGVSGHERVEIDGFTWKR